MTPPSMCRLEAARELHSHKRVGYPSDSIINEPVDMNAWNPDGCGSVETFDDLPSHQTLHGSVVSLIPPPQRCNLQPARTSSMH